MYDSAPQSPRKTYVQVETGPSFVDLINQDGAVSPILEPEPEAIATPRQPLLHNGDDNKLGLRPSSAEDGHLECGKDENLVISSSMSLDPSSAGTQNTASVPAAAVWKGPPIILLIGESLGITLSICFLVLGACVMSLENMPESAWSHRVIQATKIAPSVWPIIFSSVLGNSVRAWADLKVERGISLLTLEQLLGSLTMASSIITIFRWSVFRWTSAILLFLWAFNPLGSQASFRGVSLQPRTGTSQGSVTYYNASVEVQLLLATFQEPRILVTKPITRTLYTSLLSDYVASIQYVDPASDATKKVVDLLGGHASAGTQAAMDPWGNLRIPNIDYYSDYDSENPHRWLKVPWDERVMNYASLLGDRVDGVNRTFVGNTSFLISSSYQRFKCEEWISLNLNLTSQGHYVAGNNSQADDWFIENTLKNIDDHGIVNSTNRTVSVDKTFYVTHSFSRAKNGTVGPRSDLIFALTGRNDSTIKVTTCSGKTTYVDANVTCISNDPLGKAVCGVNALRKTPLPPENTNRTVLGNSIRSNRTYYHLTDVLGDGERSRYSENKTSSLMELYLHDPLTAFQDTDRVVDVGELDIETFERRFSLLWNTLWKILYMEKTAMGGKLYVPKQSWLRRSEMLLNSISYQTVPFPRVFVIDKAWISIYFFSVTVMCLVSVFSFVVRSQCHAPVILGYVSSLMRDSKYFQGRGLFENSAEEGTGMSKRLGGLEVMVADVREWEGEAGRIAFVPADVGRLVEKGRRYQ